MTNPDWSITVKPDPVADHRWVMAVEGLVPGYGSVRAYGVYIKTRSSDSELSEVVQKVEDDLKTIIGDREVATPSRAEMTTQFRRQLRRLTSGQ